MRTRTRGDEERQPSAAQYAEGGGQLGGLRQRGDDLLDAADDAINRALTGDSTRFLVANRQQGGQ